MPPGLVNATAVGQTVVIKNLVAVGVNNTAPYLYSIGINGVTNQISCKDAGAWSVSTWYLN